MLAPGNYVQWKSRIKRYIDTKPNSELIHYCLQNPPYTYQWAEKTVPVANCILKQLQKVPVSVLFPVNYNIMAKAMTLVKQSQERRLSPIHKLMDILKQHKMKS
ncbi:hypothetical protein Tco_0952848 [Tanacetum coccineum]|uniref:Uncharacterized protein n=1 Tax=Tanacetum coccineum TaxID=301880 RepID=A0ABQ5E017_9ASTR